jgi:GTP cyclohydrolase I
MIRELLEYVGEDPDREGLRDTPKRVLDAWAYWCSGYKQDAQSVLKTFEDGAENYDQIILECNVPVYSHCEHHMAPFLGVAHIGYLPDKKIVGLSKLPRLIDVFARRLQVQERLTVQIADALEKYLKPCGVAVILECRHLCMESRGVRAIGTITKTSAMRGAFLKSPEARAEFLSLI